MIKNLFFAIFLFTGVITASAQSTLINWQRSYGGSDFDGAYKIEKYPGNGYIAAGYSWSTDGDVHNLHGWNYSDGWLLRLNDNGDTLWTRTLGGTYTDYINDFLILDNGDILLALDAESTSGDVTDNIGSYDFWIVRMDSNGNIIWKKSYGGTLEDRCSSIIKAADGNFVIFGRSLSSNVNVSLHYGTSSYTDGWFIKIDGNGNVLWDKTIGGTDSDFINRALLCSDGGFFLVGETWSSDIDVADNNGYCDVWAVKTDSLGNIEWEQTFGGSAWDYGYGAAIDQDGSYYVGAITSSADGDITNLMGYYDAWLIKISVSGDLLWQKTYGGSLDDGIYDLTATPGGGCLLSAYSKSTDFDLVTNHGDEDIWIVKVNPDGVIEWDEILGGSTTDFAFDISPMGDGTYAIAGTSRSSDIDLTSNKGESDMWIATLNCLPLSVPEICMVTVDSATNRNLVLWDNQFNSGLQSYYIYQESIIAGNYNIIGLVPAGDPGFFLDMSANPAVQAYRYKIAVLDSCSNLSPMSGWHQTMHMTMSQAVPGGVNLIWSHYQQEDGTIAFGSGFYVIMRGTSSLSLAPFDTISSNFTSYTDLDDSQIYYYKIGAYKPDSCFLYFLKTVSGPYSNSFSNLDDNAFVVTGKNNFSQDGFMVYPNPVNNILNIEKDASYELERIEIVSTTGQIIDITNNLSESGDNYQVDISALKISDGIYYLRISDTSNKIHSFRIAVTQ